MTGRTSVKLIRTRLLTDLNPYFHGTVSRSGAPLCGGCTLDPPRFPPRVWVGVRVRVRVGAKVRAKVRVGVSFSVR